MKTETIPPNIAELTDTKRLVFALITSILCVVAILSVAEGVLRYRKSAILDSDAMDPGLVRYHSRLGWVLAPNWSGIHRHNDFEVHYTTTHRGIRNDSRAANGNHGGRVAFVGDSFAFGLGVNDDETFVHHLNASKSALRYENYSVPGYSTDQQYLLIQDRVLPTGPKRIVLATYLGNDLFDNQLPFPLQAPHAKPYFELTDNRLVLRNTPVPLKTKAEAQQQADLAQMVLGRAAGNPHFLADVVDRFEIFRLLDIQSERLFNRRLDLDDGRFDGAMDLYVAIVKEIRQHCQQRGVEFALVLMPGSSFVQRPWSVSARCQTYFRQEILNRMHLLEIDVIDVAVQLKSRHPSGQETWFYPNEGHLTPRGHRVVADIIADYL